MSQEYVVRTMREVIVKSNGNIKNAQTMLLEQAKTDEQLLYGLTQPYLGGIVAHALDRLIKQHVPKQSENKSAYTQGRVARERQQRIEIPPPVKSGMFVNVQKTKEKPIKPVSGLAKTPERFSMDGLLSALAANISDGNDIAQSGKPKAVSKEHISALHLIAKHKYRVKEDK